MEFNPRFERIINACHDKKCNEIARIEGFDNLHPTGTPVQMQAEPDSEPTLHDLGPRTIDRAYIDTCDCEHTLLHRKKLARFHWLFNPQFSSHLKQVTTVFSLGSKLAAAVCWDKMNHSRFYSFWWQESTGSFAVVLRSVSAWYWRSIGWWFLCFRRNCEADSSGAREKSSLESALDSFAEFFKVLFASTTVSGPAHAVILYIVVRKVG